MIVPVPAGRESTTPTGSEPAEIVSVTSSSFSSIVSGQTGRSRLLATVPARINIDPLVAPP
jgi:hypothetical protein